MKNLKKNVKYNFYRKNCKIKRIEIIRFLLKENINDFISFNSYSLFCFNSK